MSPLFALAPISLDDLDATAARQTRIDRKYVVPRSLVAPLVTGLADAARVLEIDGIRRFGYRSVYLDTPELTCWRAAGQKRRRRFKVRTRTYLTTGAGYLEVKTRGPRGATVKNRLAHPDGTLSAAGRTFLTESLDAAAIDPRIIDRLTPSLVTTYTRSTLHLGADRATIDTGLSWEATDPGALIDGIRLEHLAIVETKGGATPTLLDRRLWRLGHRPVRISKYGTGLALLDPRLPHLKWHRTLTHTLAA